MHLSAGALRKETMVSATQEQNYSVIDIFVPETAARPSMVVHAFHPNTWEAEVRGSLRVLG